MYEIAPEELLEKLVDFCVLRIKTDACIIKHIIFTSLLKILFL